MERIANSMQKLNQQLKNFKSVSESDLGRVWGDVNTKVFENCLRPKKELQNY